MTGSRPVRFTDKSLADTIVSAVVIFSIVMDVAVMASKRKAPLITLGLLVEDHRRPEFESVESQPRWSIIRDVLHWVE